MNMNAIARTACAKALALRDAIYRTLDRTPLSNRLNGYAMGVLATLLTDAVLFAGFAAVMAMPMALLHVRPLAALAIDVALWLAMDAAACTLRHLRNRKAAKLYLSYWEAATGREDD